MNVTNPKTIELRAGASFRQAPTARLGHAYVAFLDLIGFVDVVAEAKSSEALWDEMENMRFLACNLFQRCFPNPDDPPVNAGLILVGDAFVLFDFDSAGRGPASLIRVCSDLVGVLLHRGWRVRGGISAGDLLVSNDRTHYLGPALARAKRLEEAQEWCGGAIDPTLSEDPAWSAMFSRLTNEGYLSLPDLIPIREDRWRGIRPRYALGWPRGIGLSHAELKKRLSSLDPHPGEARSIRFALETMKLFDFHKQTNLIA